jgi:hypothetical protein
LQPGEVESFWLLLGRKSQKFPSRERRSIESLILDDQYQSRDHQNHFLRHFNPATSQFFICPYRLICHADWIVYWLRLTRIAGQ